MQKLITLIKKEADILIILAVGVGFRLKDIARDDLWFDEAFTGVLMKLPFNEFVEVVAKDATPPLYYYLSRVWTMLFGSDDFALRLLPTLTGIGTIYVAYLVGKTLFNKESGLLSAILIAISPFFTGYSIEARAYSLFGFVTILTFYFLIKHKTIAFVLGMVVMLFTHYMSIGFIGAFLLVYTLINKNNLKKVKRDFVWFIPLIVLIVYQLKEMVQQSEVGLNSGWMRPSSIINIPRSLIAYLFGIKVRLPGADALNDIDFIFNEYVWGGILVVAFGIGLIYTAYNTYKSDRETFIKLVYLVISFLVPQGLLIFYGLFKGESLYVERYLFPAAIFFMLTAGMLLKKLFSFEISAIIIGLYVVLILNLVPHPYYTGMKSLAKEFGSEPSEIVFVSPLDYVVAKHYFGIHNKNVKLQDPQNPMETFVWWPLIDEPVLPNSPQNAFYVSADPNVMTEEFVKIEAQEDFGDYEIYMRR